MFGALALIPIFLHNDYWGTILDTAGTYALVAVGLNLLCGERVSSRLVTPASSLSEHSRPR